ncbi:hypothetical protein ACF0H5_014015 [Mactra antiquata]
MAAKMDLSLCLLFIYIHLSLSQYTCEQSSYTLYPDVNECQIFYDCSKPTSKNALTWLSVYAQECPYPELFDANTLKCEKPSQVDCGSRRRPEYACEYLINLCTDQLCWPCRDDFKECSSNLKATSGETSGYSADECGFSRFIQKLTCPIDETGNRMILDSSGCPNFKNIRSPIVL